MILYLDTSALVKLYIDEEGASQIREGVRDAEVAATCEIAYVELRAALARHQRDGSLKPTEHRRALRDLHADWPQFFLITIGSSLVRAAGDIAERYHLRAYDAVHLASSLAVQVQIKEAVTFACWDRTLVEAAIRAGLQPLIAL